MTAPLEDKAALGAAADVRPTLVVDDDRRFCDRLARALAERGFSVATAYDLARARSALAERLPDYAVIDLRLGQESGLDLVQALKERAPNARVVVLTGYGNIASAVAAVKIGAVDYLAKPADADQIAAALLAGKTAPLPPPPAQPMSAERARWEHIQRVFELCGRNVSETARRLRMHRRTLQRILGKNPPRE